MTEFLVEEHKGAIAIGVTISFFLNSKIKEATADQCYGKL